jgi:hypothetical protein
MCSSQVVVCETSGMNDKYLKPTFFFDQAKGLKRGEKLDFNILLKLFVHAGIDWFMEEHGVLFLLRPKSVRVCIILALAIFLIGFTIAYAIAYFVGGTQGPPDTFSVVHNYISDLGSYNFTPAPYLFDVICMVTASLLVIIFTYANKVLVNELAEAKEGLAPTRLGIMHGFRLLGYIASVVGAAGFFGIGVFSEDRNRIGNFTHMHFIVSAMVWGGLVFGSLGLGLLAVQVKVFIPKPLGVFMIIGPLAPFVIFSLALLIHPYPLPTRPLEWIMLAAVFCWTIPVGGIIFKMTR